MYEDISGLTIGRGDTYCGSVELRSQLNETGASGQFTIWLLGGGTYDTPKIPQRKFFNDVWSTPDGEHWDCETGTIEGTSYLVLPRWLNWFTVNIGYHHIHHLSASIPNYCLSECHKEYQELFSRVTRLKLSEVLGALKCILWDTRTQRIISVAEYHQPRQAAPV